MTIMCGNAWSTRGGVFLEEGALMTSHLLILTARNEQLRNFNEAILFGEKRSSGSSCSIQTVGQLKRSRRQKERKCCHSVHSLQTNTFIQFVFLKPWKKRGLLKKRQSDGYFFQCAPQELFWKCPSLLRAGCHSLLTWLTHGWGPILLWYGDWMLPGVKLRRCRMSRRLTDPQREKQPKTQKLHEFWNLTRYFIEVPHQEEYYF